jgi:hypothetical protein
MAKQKTNPLLIIALIVGAFFLVKNGNLLSNQAMVCTSSEPTTLERYLTNGNLTFITDTYDSAICTIYGTETNHPNLICRYGLYNEFWERENQLLIDIWNTTCEYMDSFPIINTYNGITYYSQEGDNGNILLCSENKNFKIFFYTDNNYYFTNYTIYAKDVVKEYINIYYICQEEQPQCVPNCQGKVCGDDGCGGGCGTCSSGETCFAGNCMWIATSPKCGLFQADFMGECITDWLAIGVVIIAGLILLFIFRKR